jgi:hypothetical protein
VLTETAPHSLTSLVGEPVAYVQDSPSKGHRGRLMSVYKLPDHQRSGSESPCGGVPQGSIGEAQRRENLPRPVENGPRRLIAMFSRIRWVGRNGRELDL